MVKWFWIWEDNSIENEEVVEYHEIETESEIWQIAVDIVESDAAMTIVAPVAGIDLDDIDVSLNNEVMTISWIRHQPENIYIWDKSIKNSECFWWKFTRSIILPENLDFDSVKATMESSVLMIKINKLNFTSKNIQVENLDD